MLGRTVEAVVQLATRSYADEIIALEHHTVRINIDLAFADDHSLGGHAFHLVGFLSFDDVIVVLFPFGLVIGLCRGVSLS